ncbi:hypothetical protein [Martelella mediterranea]|uniref:hypothetical protein n=1 Tax=Martelella mediterranea TaxID=293089 RepID=UPI00104A7310|nr:hypothetical protein [Martelella mediterranea]
MPEVEVMIPAVLGIQCGRAEGIRRKTPGRQRSSRQNPLKIHFNSRLYRKIPTGMSDQKPCPLHNYKWFIFNLLCISDDFSDMPFVKNGGGAIRAAPHHRPAL